MLLFTKRRRAAEVAGRVRRICDLTVSYEFRSAGPMRRRSRRYQRCIPVLLAPWRDGRIVPEEAQFGVTHSLCDSGMAVVLTEAIEAPEVCAGFWLTQADPTSEPCFFLGARKHLVAIGGNFFNMGMEFTQYLTEIDLDQLAALQPLLDKLGHPHGRPQPAPPVEAAEEYA